MHEDAPVMQNSLAKSLRTEPQNLRKFQYFEYVVDTSKVLSAIGCICIFNIHQFVLPGIKDNTLWLYNVKTSVVQSLPISTSFYSGHRLCFLDDESILVIGSNDASPKAFTITLPSVQVTQIQPMLTPRRLPGLIAVGVFAYVFGGKCVQCEN